MFSRLNSGQRMVAWWQDRDFLVGNLIVVLALAIIYWFPAEQIVWREWLVTLVFFVGFPIVATKFVLKKPVEFIHIAWGRSGVGFFLVLIGWGVITLVAWGVLNVFNPPQNQVVPPLVRAQFQMFLIYLLLFWTALLSTEVLFRGMFMAVWRQRTGAWSILVQATLAILWIALAKMNMGWTWWEGILLSTWACIAGAIAYVSKSVLYSFLFSAVSVILVVMLAFYLLK